MKIAKIILNILLFACALVALSSCHENNPVGLIDGDDETRTFLFGLHGFGPEERFTASTSDPDVIRLIREQLALPESERFLHIHGPIDWVNGDGNLNWSWRFIPNQWALVESSIELCDGVPSSVENDLKYWIEEVGSFCPWHSYVLMEMK